MKVINACELCGMSGEELNIRERDDCDGKPHLVCQYCWEILNENEPAIGDDM